VSVVLDERDRAAIEAICRRYPKRAAALLPVLHYVQHKLGHLPADAQLAVAEVVDVPPTRVREVVSFYEMFHEHPEGQHHLELCTNISCHLLGGHELLDHVKARLGIEVGHTTEDGLFSLMEVECLASCGSGPTMKVGEDYYEQLTPEAVDALIDDFRKNAPALAGRPYVSRAGGPHTGPVPGFAARLPVLPTSPAPPKVEAPKVEAAVEPPKAEPPKVEPPKVEAKAEPPKVEAKVEPPKVEAKVEPPKVEPPKVEAKLPSFDPPPLKKKDDPEGKAP
jgi:NADH-quinone oxidoreductase E subunit